MVDFSLKKKLLPSLMAAALVSGVTFTGNAHAIHLAEDGIGQVLLGPLYLADFGYKTKVAIVNTNSTKAVKAKVVLRSSVASTELLDFICYLTPADVCRFEIREENGKIVMYSDDDSIKSPVSDEVKGVPVVDSLERTKTTFASILPVTQPLFVQNLGRNDTSTMGHIEVFGLYAVDGTVVGRTQNDRPVPVTIERGMAKFALAQIFDTPRYLENYDNSLYYHGTTLEYDRATESGTRDNDPSEQTERLMGSLAPLASLSMSRIRSTDPSWIQLVGNVEMVSSVDRVAYRFPALAGAIGDNVSFPYMIPAGLHATAAQWDGLVVANPRWDANAANETGIGVNFGINTFGLPNYDKTVEIEAALAATNLQQSFEDESSSNQDTGYRTRLLVTFPTRYRHNPTVDPCATGVTGSQFSPPFQPDGAMLYNLTAYNNFEETTVTTGTPFSGGPRGCQDDPNTPQNECVNKLAEVNYFIPKWPTSNIDANGNPATGTIDFRSGWFDMNLEAKTDPSNGCTSYYPGAPVLSFTHKYIETSNGFTQSWFVPTVHQPVRSCDSMSATDSCPSMMW
ncbi:MAG: hypothetical protein HC877_15355 [Thioploca sp.]|nr:hypothetical protein [Thioploca sp.]